MQFRLIFSFKSWCVNIRETGLVRLVACNHFHATGCCSGTSASIRTTNVKLSGAIQILQHTPRCHTADCPPGRTHISVPSKTMWPGPDRNWPTQSGCEPPHPVSDVAFNTMFTSVPGTDSTSHLRVKSITVIVIFGWVSGGWVVGGAGGRVNSHSNGYHVSRCIRSGAGLLPFHLSLITPCPAINKHSCLYGKLLKRLHS